MRDKARYNVPHCEIFVQRRWPHLQCVGQRVGKIDPASWKGQELLERREILGKYQVTRVHERLHAAMNCSLFLERGNPR